MPPILLGEYRNQHGRRQYPFADDVSLADSAGQRLPTDFLLDAFLYPIDLANSLYLSTVNLDERRIYFADTGTGTIHGYVEFELGDTTGYVYEDNDYGRQIGILVFGDGLASLFQGTPLRTFAAEATPLCPTAYMPLNQEGVRGFVLEDGTLVTGAVEIEAQDGLTVTSQIDMTGRNILKLDVVGVLKADADECGYECPLIKEVCLHRMPGSAFMISEYDDCTGAVNSYGFTLEDICGAQRLLELPDEDGNLPLRPKPGDDPCEDPPFPPVPPDPGPELEFCFDIEACGGNFFLIAPSTAGTTNAVSIKELSHIGKQDTPRLVFPNPLNGPQEAIEQASNFVDPPRFTDGLSIGFKGLANYRRQTK